MYTFSILIHKDIHRVHFQEVAEAWNAGLTIDRSHHTRGSEEKSYTEAEISRRILAKQLAQAQAKK
jgi:hypothetical protein